MEYSLSGLVLENFILSNHFFLLISRTIVGGSHDSAGLLPEIGYFLHLNRYIALLINSFFFPPSIISSFEYNLIGDRIAQNEICALHYHKRKAL